MYKTHSFKYLLNWGSHTKGDLNLKSPNWGSFDIPKLIFLWTYLEKPIIRSNRLNEMLILISRSL